MYATACEFEESYKEEPASCQDNFDSPVNSKQGKLDAVIQINPISEKKNSSQNSKKKFNIQDRVITQGEAVQEFPDENFLKWMDDAEEPVVVPINGILDLHGFKPSEIKSIIEEFLFACCEKNILQGRLVHGKGIGTLREVVHAHLKVNPLVKSYQLGDQTSGGWGATLFELHEDSKK